MGDVDIAHEEQPRGEAGIMRMGETIPHGVANDNLVILLVLLPSYLRLTGVGKTKALSNSRNNTSHGPRTRP